MLLTTRLLRVSRAVQRIPRRSVSRSPVNTPVFRDFLDGLSTGFDISDHLGCSFTTEPVSGELIGRKVELQEVLDLLSVNLSEGSRYPVIQMAAPPGSGKSAFLTELARIFLDQTDKRRGYGKMFSKETTVREP